MKTMTQSQKDIMDRLAAQDEAVAQDPTRFSPGLFLGGRHCHRATVASMVRAGLVVVRRTSAGDIVEAAK